MAVESSFITELTESLTNRWNEILKVEKPYEFEFRLGKQESNTNSRWWGTYIQRDVFDRIVKYLKSLDLVGRQEVSLNIIPNGDVGVITILGMENIRKYCRTNDLSGLPITTFIKKGSVDVILSEWNLRYQSRTERVIEKDTDEYALLMDAYDTKDRIYNYKTRLMIVDNASNMRYDLTVTKMISAKPKEPLSAVLAQAYERYQVEVEYVGDFVGDSKTIIDNIVGVMNKLVAVYQNTNVVMSIDKYVEISDKYLELAYPSLTAVDVRPRGRLAFIGMDVVTLEHYHLIKGQKTLMDVLMNYQVTYKADGSRRLMYISDTGRVYLISTKMDIYDTGYTNKKLVNSILDSELVHTNVRSVLVFDAFIVNGVDVRSKLLVGDEQLKTKNLGKEQYRMNVVENVVDLLCSKATEFSVGANYGIIFKKKEYYSLVEKNMVTNELEVNLSVCQTVLDLYCRADKGTSVCRTDGLIFTPNCIEEPYPVATADVKRSTIWKRLLKWKPLTELSNDFMINLTGETKIKSTNEAKHLMKLSELMVIGRDRKPMKFVPETGDQQNADRVYLRVSDDNTMRAKDNSIITNGSIVEFIYEGGVWVPLRLRPDKYNPNSDYVAQSNWRTIIDPITEAMITGKDTPSEQYYQNVSNGQKRLTENLRDFHNKVKTKLLVSGVAKARGNDLRLLDIGCGRVGDLHKWHMIVKDRENVNKPYRVTLNSQESHNNNAIKYVMAVDKSHENLYKVNGNAQARVRQAKRDGNYSKLMVQLVEADFSKKYTVAGVRQEDQDVLNALNDKFDIVSCFYAVHYFCGTVDDLRGLFSNVSGLLKVGGYFLIADLDGALVYQSLMASKGNIVGLKQNEEIWSIKRCYDESEKFIDVSQQVLVYNVSISNQAMTEYLVNFETLVTIAGEFGMIPSIKPALGLGNNTGLFSTLRKDNESMEKAELTYSDLHRFLVLEKLQ